MKNNTINAIVRRLIGKALILGILTTMFVAASYAQSNNLYYANNTRARYGRVTVFPSHFQIDTPTSQIKTFRNSCSPASSNGVPGVRCTFGEFRNGQHSLSGWAYFFQNGITYLMWTNERVAGNQWRTINTGWYTFVPGA